MGIAFRYVNREVLAIFLVALAMLLLVALGGRFISYLQEAAMGKFTGTTVLIIMAYRLPEFVQLVAPFAIYVAVLMTISRLYADQEMVVLQTAGTSLQRLLLWLSAPLLLVVALVAVLAFVFTPQANLALNEFLAAERAQSEFETVNPGTFHVYDRGRRVTYAQDMSDDRRVLEEVFIAQRLDDGRQVTLWSETGERRTDPSSGSQFLLLKNGKRYEGQPGQGGFRVMEFAELSQRLSVQERRSTDGVEGATTSALFTGSGDVAIAAELHWRIGQPLFCFVGGLLALAIARVKPREGRFAKVVPGMILMLGYYLALMLNHNLLAEGVLPSAAGLWLVHIVFAGLSVYLLRRVNRPVVV